MNRSYVRPFVAELLGTHRHLAEDAGIRGAADELAAALDAERRHRE